MSTMLARTATAMVEVLDKNGRMQAGDFHAAVEAAGGYSAYIIPAAKFLRESGLLVVSKKARHRSEWFLASAPKDVEVWEERVRREHYSELRSQARALTAGNSKPVREARNRVISNAVSIGVDLGKSAREVIEECEPTTAALTA